MMSTLNIHVRFFYVLSLPEQLKKTDAVISPCKLCFFRTFPCTSIKSFLNNKTKVSIQHI